MSSVIETPETWTQAKALRLAIPALGFTQMTGWGTTYYIPAVLGKQFERDLGLSDGVVFGAIAVMLIVSALASWPMGKQIDRLGARLVMPSGSAVFALSLALLSLAHGFWSYFACWSLMGLGMTMALSNAAFAGLTQIAGSDSRRAIAMLMLFGGMASTVFWPLTLWLEGVVGWRNVCLVFAALHLLVCAPLHWLALPNDEQRRRVVAQSDADFVGSLPFDVRKKAALLMLATMACSGFVSWGIDLHVITILMDYGLGATVAVGVAALKGPATLLARGVDFFAQGRVSPMASALAAGGLTSLGLIMALVLGREAYGPILFVVVFSFGTGLMTIVRATLPLSLLGAIGYATTLGRFALPTHMIYAFAPMVFGFLINGAGVHFALSISLIVSLLSLLAMMALAHLVKENVREKG